MALHQSPTHNNSDQDARFERAKRLAHALDAKWRIPVLGLSIGWDSVLGLIPGIGDVLMMAASLFIVKQAHDMGVSFWSKCRMIFNIFVDWLLGSIPLVGDLFDIAWKANLKNITIMEEQLHHR